MRTHFEEHVLYHDAIDRREAKERAMRAEAEQTMICPVCDRSLYIVRGRKAICPIDGPVEIVGECTCGPNDAPMCPSCKARHAHAPLPF